MIQSPARTTGVYGPSGLAVGAAFEVLAFFDAFLVLATAVRAVFFVVAFFATFVFFLVAMRQA
jgi:hypothetical protein